MEYRIGVKRRFFFGFKVYLVVGHRTEVLGSASRLILNFASGLVETVPGLDRRAVRIYPEFQRMQQAPRPGPPPSATIPDDPEME